MHRHNFGRDFWWWELGFESAEQGYESKPHIVLACDKAPISIYPAGRPRQATPMYIAILFDLVLHNIYRTLYKQFVARTQS